MQGMDEDVGGDVPWLPPTLKIAWLMNPLTASDGTGLGISRAAKWVLAGRDLEMNPIVLFGGSGSEIFRTGVGVTQQDLGSHRQACSLRHCGSCQQVCWA